MDQPIDDPVIGRAIDLRVIKPDGRHAEREDFPIGEMGGEHDARLVGGPHGVGILHADDLNPAALKVVRDCQAEPAVAETPVGQPIQFERLGYFYPDPDATPSMPVFNRTIGLRDSWARAQTKRKTAG